MATIDVFCVTGENGAAWATLLRRGLVSLASGRNDLRFKQITLEADRTRADGWDVVFNASERKRNFKGDSSLVHGMALNRVVDLADGEFVLYADADVAVLKSEWDEIMLREIVPPVGVVGVGYDDFSRHYQAFPNAIFMLVPTAVLKRVRPDFMPRYRKPGAVQAIVVSTAEEAERFGVSIGSSIKLDTGYMVPAAFRAAGYTGTLIPYVATCSSASKLPIVDPGTLMPLVRKDPRIHAEYHWRGELFATHMLASKGYGPGSPRGALWLKRISAYLKSTGVE